MPTNKDGKTTYYPPGTYQSSSSSWMNSATSALGQIVGTAVQARGGKKAREDQRKHEINMYNRQVQDRLKFWEMENLYNTPAQQMKRLKEAGLNPNLAYGNYSSQTSGSIQAPEMHISDVSRNLNPMLGQLPTMATGLVNQLYDLRIKDAQANLLNSKVTTEATVQEYNAARNGLTELLQQSEQLKLALGQKTFNELVRQAVTTTQSMQAKLLNIRSDTELKKVSADLGGSKKTGQDISNELLQLEKDLYSGKLGVPGSGIDKLLKLLQPLLLLFKNK